MAKIEGLYDADHPRIWHLTTDEAPAIFHWITLSVAGSLFFIRALPDETITARERRHALRRRRWRAAFVLRSVARAIWRRRVPPERALVLGPRQARRRGVAQAGARARPPPVGARVLVRATTTNGSTAQRRNAAPRVQDRGAEQGGPRVPARGGRHRARRARRCPSSTRRRSRASSSSCRATGVKLSVMPPMRAMLGTAVQLNHIAEMPVIEYGTWGTSPSTMAIKRAVDVVLSAVGHRGPGAADARRSRWPSGSPRAARRCSGRSAPGATASRSRSSSSARCAATPRSASPR